MPDVLWDWLAWLASLLLGYAKRRPYVVVVVVLAILRSLGTTVQSGSAGVLFSWGRARKVLEPGFHPLLPVVQHVRMTPVRSVTLDLPPQRVTTADGLVYGVEANIVFRVEDPITALTAVADLRKGVADRVPLLVADVVRARTREGLSARAEIDAELTARAREALARWGLAVEQAGLSSIAPTPTTARLTQLGGRARERARLLGELVRRGVSAEVAAVLVSGGQGPQAHGRRRYRPRRPPPPPSAAAAAASATDGEGGQG